MGVNDVVDPTQNGKNVPNWIGYESGFLDAESVSAYAKNHRYGLRPPLPARSPRGPSHEAAGRLPWRAGTGTKKPERGRHAAPANCLGDRGPCGTMRPSHKTPRLERRRPPVAARSRPRGARWPQPCGSIPGESSSDETVTNPAWRRC